MTYDSCYNSKSWRNYRRVFYAAYGFGPYECFFCRERTVPFDGGRTKHDLHVHHIDGDVANNHPLNLTAAHNGCHRRWHVLVDGIPNKHVFGKGNEFGGRHNREQAKITRNATYRETMRWAFSASGH